MHLSVVHFFITKSLIKSSRQYCHKCSNLDLNISPKQYGRCYLSSDVVYLYIVEVMSRVRAFQALQDVFLEYVLTS